MSDPKVNTIKNKALSLNLNASFYGTIAEIGGGQEVARAFFQAGGASGTIAKSISAYDKTFSDKLYNKGLKERYVSEKRLFQMLNKEYEELEENLNNSEKKDKKYFVFADTVEILNYSKSNIGHGWAGVKFQLHSDSQPNIVTLHIKLLENDGALQQYTMGALGVNLIYACVHYSDRPNFFLQSLMDNLDRDRVEINMVRMSGPDLEYVDNRLLSVQLVKNNMTNATVFDRHGEVCQPADFLYKKNLLLLRGSFRPITYIGFDMLKSSYGFLKKEVGFSAENTLQLCEITLNNLIEEGNFDERDFLARVDLLNGMGQNVMITNFQEFYKLSDYITELNIGKAFIILGANILEKIFQLHWYRTMKGDILQAMGQLFNKNVVVLVYPFIDVQTGTVLTTESLHIQPEIHFLYKYLLENSRILDLKDFKKNKVNIFSKDVLSKIQNRDATWEEMVPKYISRQIKEKQLFGYTP